MWSGRARHSDYMLSIPKLMPEGRFWQARTETKLDYQNHLSLNQRCEVLKFAQCVGPMRPRSGAARCTSSPHAGETDARPNQRLETPFRVVVVGVGVGVVAFIVDA